MTSDAPILFISDLHLDARRPDITAGLRQLLQSWSGRCQALYVLGDLFEVWVGDDDDDPLVGEVADAFASFVAGGSRLYFMAGNRDFLLGDDYAARCGMERLSEPHRMHLFGHDAVLLHGDALCTDDTVHQEFRRVSLDPAWQARMLAQPLAARRAIAADVRAQSAHHTANAPDAIMDVNRDAVARCYEDAGVRLMIHGHTHRPAIHREEHPGHERIVLAAWHEQGNFLQVDSSGRRLEYFPPPRPRDSLPSVAQRRARAASASMKASSRSLKPAARRAG